MNVLSDYTIESTWEKILSEEFNTDYFSGINSYLQAEWKQGKTIYPPKTLIFGAFNMVSLEDIKIVILGQDPYHNPHQAHGLSFSVPITAKTPASLRNVYKELRVDIEGFEKPNHGNLESWAKQGVFLLNAFLTVEHKKPASHRKIGWGKFTDSVISKISAERKGVVFMLWGNFAKKKADLIDPNKHLILQSAHPSPLAGNAFLGNKHFSRANNYLKSMDIKPVDWYIRPK